MLKDITLGQYIPGDSLLHRADPRTKIVIVFLLMTILFMVDSFAGFGLFALFMLLVVVISDIPLRFTLKGLKPVMFIVLFTAVINILTVKGHVWLDLGLVKVTREGVEISVKLALRMSLLIMSASLLTLTSTPISLTDGLEKLMAPLKKIGIPVHEISMMMTIALRFIPTLMEETDKIIKAQSARGADFDTGNLIQKAKSFIPVLVPLFVSAFRRAEELATAMEARCYRGSEGRTRMKQLKLTGVDLVISSITAVFVGAVLYLEFFL